MPYVFRFEIIPIFAVQIRPICKYQFRIIAIEAFIVLNLLLETYSFIEVVEADLIDSKEAFGF
jgi:hypothetical protein